jgi:pyruvate/2-oxoglutarate dehydrogenase complex dihydrolipoamide dehydrogenase (E3) component
MSYQYQVIVVGSGSAGKEACLKAAKAGLRTLLIEDKTLGGTAYYAGSYAVRALRACASYLNQTEKASKAGTHLDLIESSWTKWMTSQRVSSGKLAIEFSNAIDHEKVDLKFGRARLVGPHEISLTDAQNGLEVRITSGHIILATGSRPNFPGQPDVGVLNSNQILREANPARHLFVIGGGYVGCELAAIYRDLGSRVTIAEAKSRLLPNWDPIAGEYFQSVLHQRGATVLLNESIEPLPQSSKRPPATS